MKRLKDYVVRIFWRMKHKEATQKVRNAELGLQSARAQAHTVHHAIYQPGKALRDENNFANIIRGSLRIGYKDN